jgi:hypothetical protein
VIDAARLVRAGEIVVFGSASLSFWLANAPTSRDVDLWVVPEESGHTVEALMGELSWYHDKHGAYVEVLGPETFSAPTTWRERAVRVRIAEAPNVTVLVPHPHDVLVSKLERFSPQDQDHVRRILAEASLDTTRLEALANASTYRKGLEPPASVLAFEQHLSEVRAWVLNA